MCSVIAQIGLQKCSLAGREVGILETTTLMEMLAKSAVVQRLHTASRCKLGLGCVQLGY
jgi:hypothetical protein